MTEHPETRMTPEDGRFAIRRAAGLLLDDLMHCLVHGPDEYFLCISELPAGYQHKIEKDLYRWSVVFAVAGLKLTRTERLPSACVAESLAMFAILDFAATMLQEGPDYGLPERVPERVALSWREDVIEPLVKDRDFLFLHDARADGIGADPEEPIGAMLGTENLAYKDWFRPYDDQVGHPFFDEYDSAGDDWPWL